MPHTLQQSLTLAKAILNLRGRAKYTKATCTLVYARAHDDAERFISMCNTAATADKAVQQQVLTCLREQPMSPKDLYLRFEDEVPDIVHDALFDLVHNKVVVCVKQAGSREDFVYGIV